MKKTILMLLLTLLFVSPLFCQETDDLTTPKGLREKFRELKRELKSEIKIIQKSCEEFSLRINELSAEIKELDKRLEDIKSPEPELPSGLPSKITNLQDLKQFILVKFTEESTTYQTELKTICGKVRDSLAETYPDIKRINDLSEYNYSAPETKHRDAFHIISKQVNVDFCIASSAPGILLERLTWSETRIDKSHWLMKR